MTFLSLIKLEIHRRSMSVVRMPSCWSHQVGSVRNQRICFAGKKLLDIRSGREGRTWRRSSDDLSNDIPQILDRTDYYLQTIMFPETSVRCSLNPKQSRPKTTTHCGRRINRRWKLSIATKLPAKRPRYWGETPTRLKWLIHMYYLYVTCK
jgi:hypothetical protein